MAIRHSSLCRFSNCSKREEISACLLAWCGERPAVSGARCLSSYMSLDGTLRTKSHPPERDVSHIVGTLSGFQQRKQRRKVPEGQLDGWTRDENGAPLSAGTPSDLLLGRPESRLILWGLDFGRGVRLGVLLEEVESGGLFGSELGGFRNLLEGSRSGHFRQQLDAAVVLEAGASGDEAAHDYVFLEAAEIVHFAGDSRFRKDASGLLEARGGNERVRGERRLGDSKEQRTTRCGAASIGDNAVVFLSEAELVHLLLEEERRITHVLNLDPAHHLARDRLNVLVVDVHALEAVNLLNGVDQVRLRELLAENGEQVVQVERAIDEGL